MVGAFAVLAPMEDDYTTSFRVGDYVTAVYLPHDPDRSLRLYGFLDLLPTFGLVRRSEQEVRSDYLWKIPLLIAVIVMPLFMLLFSTLLGLRLAPLKFGLAEGRTPFSLGAGFGVALLLGSWLGRLRDARRCIKQNISSLAAGEPRPLNRQSTSFGARVRLWWSWLVTVFSAGLAGGLMSLCCCLIGNACLDNSPPQNRPVQVTGKEVVTHAFLFRDYRMHYRLAGELGSESFLTTPEHLASFLGNDGIAEIHAGRLGWPWVKTIHAVNAARGK